MKLVFFLSQRKIRPFKSCMFWVLSNLMHAIDGITKNIQYYLLKSYLIFIGIISNKNKFTHWSHDLIPSGAFTSLWKMIQHEDANTSSAVMENNAIFWQMEWTDASDSPQKHTPMWNYATFPSIRSAVAKSSFHGVYFWVHNTLDLYVSEALRV